MYLQEDRFAQNYSLRRLLLCSATYFWGPGSNTAPYDTEAKAAPSLDTLEAIPWTNADLVKMDHTHVETAGAALSYTFPTSPGLRLFSVDFNGSGTGPMTAGASIAVGAANAAMTLGAGFVHGDGITFAAGTNNNAACDFVFGTAGTPCGHRWDNCTISVPSANTGAIIAIGGAGTSAGDDHIFEFNNCIFSNGANKSIFPQSGKIRMRNCSNAGSNVTTIFAFTSGAGLAVDLELDSCDLSGPVSVNLFSIGGAMLGHVKLRKTKVAGAFTVVTGTFGGPGSVVFELFDTHSGDEHFHYIKRCYEGSIDISNAKYADASDGTNSFSLTMVSSANASFTWPLTSPTLAAFNDTLSALTVTVPVAHNAVGGGTGGKLLNSEMWGEFNAKTTSGFTQGTWNIADRVADALTAGADQDTDGTTSWTGSSIGTHDKLVSGSITPAEVGTIEGVIKLAKPSVTVQVSPKMIIA